MGSHQRGMANTPIDPAILAMCALVTAKRPKTVIDHIIKNGFVTTDDLQDIGYTHGPRAARDVRELGIPLDTTSVRSAKTGRMIGAYTFGDPSKIKGGRIGGRRAFPKAFKDQLIAKYGAADTITHERIEARYLQIDHRIPYEVAGDGAGNGLDVDDYMLIDAANQRAKSWSCEGCENWKSLHDVQICKGCYWAFPETYNHIAMKPERRMDVLWTDKEAQTFDAAEKEAARQGKSLAQMVKDMVEGLASSE